jgi:hypothetical protein
MAGSAVASPVAHTSEMSTVRRGLPAGFCPRTTKFKLIFIQTHICIIYQSPSKLYSRKQ